jgi:hypothetical protein
VHETSQADASTSRRQEEVQSITVGGGYYLGIKYRWWRVKRMRNSTRIVRMILGSTEEDLLSKVESLEEMANNFQCDGNEN